MKTHLEPKVYARRAGLVTVLAISIMGCQPQGATQTSDESSAGQARQNGSPESSLPEMSAIDYLKQVFSRYRSTQSYHDRGEVRLRIEKDGRLARRIAPMHVALDGSTIWIACYDARLWSDSGKTIGWIADEQSDFHDSQVVVGGSAATAPSSARPTLEHLLRDPILTTRMTAGLGGPPPQLEWLLDADPMAKLFRDAERSAPDRTRKIQYEGVAERDQILCVVVHAVVGGDSYRFWIERSRSLIHCVELPVSMAGEQIQLEGWKIQSLELVLDGASFDPPAKPYQITEMPKADLPKVPKFVRALIPLPPPQPSPRLGSRVEPFKRPDLAGQIEISHTGADRPFTLFFASVAADDTDSELRNLHAVNQFAGWLQLANQPEQADVRPISLVDDASARLLVGAGISQAGWLLLPDRDASVRRQIGIEPGQAALVDSRGRIIWIGAAGSPADLQSLDAVISDTRAGVDVPVQIRRLWASDLKAYQEKLAEMHADSGGNTAAPVPR